MDTNLAEAVKYLRAAVAHALTITDPATRASVITQILDATADDATGHPHLAQARADVLRALADGGYAR